MKTHQVHVSKSEHHPPLLTQPVTIFNTVVCYILYSEH